LSSLSSVRVRDGRVITKFKAQVQLRIQNF